MKYNTICSAIFKKRNNRFVADVLLEGHLETVHVKNTGRCKELLVPGCTVILEKANENAKRKTKYDLIAVYKDQMLINMDSQVCNKVVLEYLKSGKLFEDIALIKPEYTYKNSRFDFYIEFKNGKKAFMEVKGITLENEQIASFPDAPTLRGLKHVQELEAALKEGYECYVFFVIQMKNIRYATPNWATHPEFGQALQKAAKSGVKILCYDCKVKEDEITIDKPVDFSFKT